MVRAALDSNILIYAALEPGSEKGGRAAEVTSRASRQGVIAAQALLEFVAVIRRRAPALTHEGIAQVDAWSQVFEVAPTTPQVASRALQLVRERRFQVWDGVIWAASREAGAVLLLTEDLQSGLDLGGLRAVNPFSLSRGELGALLGD